MCNTIGLTPTTLSIILDASVGSLVEMLAVSIRGRHCRGDSITPISQGSASKECGNSRGVHYPDRSKSKQNFVLQESRLAVAEARGGAAGALINVTCIDTRNAVGRQFEQSRVLAIGRQQGGYT